MAQPGTRLLAQLWVEIGQRLVEQDDGRLVNQRPRERHALLLAAGQLVRIALGEMLKADPVERTLDAGLDVGGADMPQLEAVCDVLKYRAVRPQRVGLKHEA